MGELDLPLQDHKHAVQNWKTFNFYAQTPTIYIILYTYIINNKYLAVKIHKKIINDGVTIK